MQEEWFCCVFENVCVLAGLTPLVKMHTLGKDTCERHKGSLSGSTASSRHTSWDVTLFLLACELLTLLMLNFADALLPVPHQLAGLRQVTALCQTPSMLEVCATMEWRPW